MTGALADPVDPGAGAAAADRSLAVRLAFPGGATGWFESTFTRDGEFRADLHVICEDGLVHLDNFIFPARGRLTATRDGAVVADEAGGGESTYVYQLRAFAAAIASGEPVPTSAEHARGDHAADRRRVPRGRAGSAAGGRAGMTPAGADAARFAADLIRIDTTNRGGGDARERPAAEYVAARLAEAGLEPVLLESAPGRANVVARIGGAGDPRPRRGRGPGREPSCCTGTWTWSRPTRRTGRCTRSPARYATGCCGGAARST